MSSVASCRPTIALIELNSQSDILANLHVIEQGVAMAAQHHAELVVLPENAFCFGNQALAAQFFEPLKDWCGKLADTYQIHLLAGTLPCPYRPDGTKVADGKFRQSSLLFEPSGDLLARYDKIHLFKATVNDSTGSYDEGRTFEAGDTPVVAKTALGNIGMMVCFDLRFAPLALRLREMGADMLTAPSAFTYQTGKAHWHSLLVARALDSQCLVVGAGQTGEHFFHTKHGKTSRETWGHSEFITAQGEMVGQSHGLVVDFNQSSPLLASAARWLLPNTASDNAPANTTDNATTGNTAILPRDNRVLLVAFDSEAQHHARQAIDLQASRRFGVVLPTTKLKSRS